MNFGIICVSDRCSQGLCQDKSGPCIKELLLPLGKVNQYEIVPDETEIIEKVLIFMCDDEKLDVVFTTGGTGFAKRDVTPEATLNVIEKNCPGISEAIRLKSFAVTPKAMLSRAVSGIRKDTLIINLPGSPKAVKESLEIILPVLSHAVEIIKGTGGTCGGNY